MVSEFSLAMVIFVIPQGLNLRFCNIEFMTDDSFAFEENCIQKWINVLKKTEKRKFPAIICLVRECIFSSNDDFVFTLMIDKSIGVLRRKYRRKIKCNSFAYSMTLVYNFLKSKYVYIQLIIAVTNCIFLHIYILAANTDTNIIVHVKFKYVLCITPNGSQLR